MLEILIIFFVCTVSGLLTGLLGIGGGLIIVPAFLVVLPIFGINLSIHQIVAVSATCVFINSSVGVFYRRRENFMPKDILIKLSVAIVIGTLLGTYFSSFAAKNVILGIYIVVCLLSLYFTHFPVYFNFQSKKTRFVLYLIFAVIGAISASIGIGGAVFFATALTCFMGKDTKNLLPSITLLVAVHAFFAFSGKFALGFVSAQIIPIAFLASLIGVKIGVIISKGLSSRTIRNLMSAALILALLRVIIEFSSDLL